MLHSLGFYFLLYRSRWMDDDEAHHVGRLKLAGG